MASGVESNGHRKQPSPSHSSSSSSSSADSDTKSNSGSESGSAERFVSLGLPLEWFPLIPCSSRATFLFLFYALSVVAFRSCSHWVAALCCIKRGMIGNLFAALFAMLPISLAPPCLALPKYWVYNYFWNVLMWQFFVSIILDTFSFPIPHTVQTKACFSSGTSLSFAPLSFGNTAKVLHTCLRRC